VGWKASRPVVMMIMIRVFTTTLLSSHNCGSVGGRSASCVVWVEGPGGRSAHAIRPQESHLLIFFLYIKT
jgi:hypothetical protein